MDTVHALAVWALFITAALSFQLFLYLWGKNRKSRSLFYLSLFLAASAWWAFWNAFEYLIPGLSAKLIAANLQYLSIPTIPVLWYSFGRSFDREERSGKGRDPRWAIWIVPVVTAVFVWFDPLFALVRSNIRLADHDGFLYIAKDFGPLFWIMWVHSYVFVVLAIIFILRGILAQEKSNKIQVVFLLIGVIFPTAANFAYVIGFSSVYDIDPTPIAFSLTAFFLIVNLKRFRFLPFVGAAREKALEELRDAVLIFDRESILVYANSAAAHFLDLRPEHIGRKIDRIGPALACLSDIRAGDEREIVLAEQRRFEVRASVISKRGKTCGLTLILYDITQRVSAEDALKELNHQLEKRIVERTVALTEELEHRIRTERQLTHTALHDPLTGLPNRSLLMNRIEQSIARFKRDHSAQYGILFIDIDDFKRINDNYGHSAGDAFLCEISSRLRRCVREIDTVARLGGDEFVILLDGMGLDLDIGTAAERVGDELSIPYNIGRNSVVSTASIGVLLSRPDIVDAGEALRDADIAMYRAKNTGKNRRVAYTDQMLIGVLENNRLTQDLRSAIGNGGIHLAFQPIVDMHGGSTVGWEVLARWRHPDFGIIGPDRFIPIAEESGLIVPLGTFIILETLKMAANLLAANLVPGSAICDPPFFAVNVSAIQLANSEFSDFVLSAIDRYALPRSLLNFELTETALIENRDTVIKTIAHLADEGISFKLDDFGTGYSSLGYLDSIPFDTVKIDRSFIEHIDMGSSKTSCSGGIVKGIISLCHELGKKVIAEGIETAAQAEALKCFGCDFGQGYLFGKPIDADALVVSLMRMGISNEVEAP